MDISWLEIDPERETERLADKLRHVLSRRLKRRGLVVGLSGGIDSSVTAALAVRALGKRRVFGLLMPERHSDSETRRLSRHLVSALDIDHAEEDITSVLDAAGCYRRYDAAVRSVISEFGPGWKSKIAIRGTQDPSGFNSFVVIAQSPGGTSVEQQLPLDAYLDVVASTNFKQRTRKMLEYYHADRLNYAVAGTPNRLEYDQGFFVKGGDGAADVKPIAHLYKTQVYRMAEYLGVPDEIRQRPPTTDTYSLPQGQDEFYFSVPYTQLDLCLYGKNHGKPADEVADVCGLTTGDVQRVWTDIDRKRAATRNLHMKPALLGAVPEIDE